MMVFVYDGVVQGQTGVLFPQLQEKDSAIHLTPDEETWIGGFEDEKKLLKYAVLE